MAGTGEAIGGFHHVAIKVADFDAAVRFYTEALGLTEALRWGEGDKRAVMLDAGDGACVEIFAGGSADAQGGGPILHFALRTDDVDAAVERVRAAGAEITMDPRDVNIPSDPVLPVRIAFFRAPGGEVVELFQERPAS